MAVCLGDWLVTPFCPVTWPDWDGSLTGQCSWLHQDKGRVKHLRTLASVAVVSVCTDPQSRLVLLSTAHRSGGAAITDRARLRRWV